MYQDTLLKIMFPSTAEVPPVPKASDEEEGEDTPKKDAGSRAKIAHRGPQFEPCAFDRLENGYLMIRSCGQLRDLGE